MADTKNTDRSSALLSEEEERLTQDTITQDVTDEEVTGEEKTADEEAEEASDEAEAVDEEAEEPSDAEEAVDEETEEPSDEAEAADEEAEEPSDAEEAVDEEAEEVSGEEESVDEETEEVSGGEEPIDEETEEPSDGEESVDEEAEEPSDVEEADDDETEEVSGGEEAVDEETEEPSDAEEAVDEEAEEPSDAEEAVDEEAEEPSDAEEADDGDEEKDELFEDAAAIAEEEEADGNAVTPFLLQRRLKIGFARAGRIYAQLTAAGLISADEEADTDEAPAGEPEEDFIDEDDYLDYEEDDARPKKTVSGRTAVVTMLAVFLGAVLAVVLAFLFATRFQRATDITLVSYTDGFSACRTNEFSYGGMLGIGTVSYSDSETAFSAEEVNALRNGQTVVKFDGLANITAKVRFGKLVSLDLKFSPELDKAANPSGLYALLSGNVISGLLPGVDSSDTGFMAAYTILSYSAPVDDDGNLFSYQTDGLNFLLDYSVATETKNISDITMHVESAVPHYLEPEQIDTSWLPELPKFSGRESEPSPSSSAVSDADVSPSDN